MLGTYLLALSIDGAAAMSKEWTTLLGDLGTTALGVVAYGALFAFLGLALKKPLFWGLLIGFGWENLVAWLPGFLKRLTLLFHLHTLLPHSAQPQGLVQQMLAASEAEGRGPRVPGGLHGALPLPGLRPHPADGSERRRARRGVGDGR